MIPNKQHWEKAWVGQDEANAFDHFHGKTLEEAEDMIHDHSEYYCEDFWWMPEIPFRFYCSAFKKYLTSPRSKDNCYAANSFIVLIEHLLEYKYDWIEDSWQSIAYVLNRLADHQDFYNYLTKPGKFRKSVDRIMAKQAIKKGLTGP